MFGLVRNQPRLGDAPDYASGRIYGPTGLATPSFPVSVYVSLPDFTKWQQEASAILNAQGAAALAKAYASIGQNPPSHTLPPASAIVPSASVAAPVAPATASVPVIAASTAPASSVGFPGWALALVGGGLLLFLSE